MACMLLVTGEFCDSMCSFQLLFKHELLSILDPLPVLILTQTAPKDGGIYVYSYLSQIYDPCQGLHAGVS